MNTQRLDEIAETKAPEDFAVILADSHKEVCGILREAAYQIFNETIDTFLRQEGGEDDG